MHSLGLDLSTDPQKSWWCEVRWPDETGKLATIVDLAPAATYGARDDASLAAVLAERLDAFGPAAGRLAGIDAPLGWPQAFVDAIRRWSEADRPRLRKSPELRLRPTDRFVQAATGLTPMSVSTDRIGSTALLAAHVLSELAERTGDDVVDRARGGQGVAEVYPAAALRLWSTDDGLPLAWAGYKAQSEARARLLHQLAAVVDLPDLPALPEPAPADDALTDDSAPGDKPLTDDSAAGGDQAGTIAVEGGHAAAMIASDDALDALLCALIAGAVARGLTFGVDDPVRAGDLVPPATRVSDPLAALSARAERAEERRVDALTHAAREGWIHVPRRAPLASLLQLSIRPTGCMQLCTPWDAWARTVGTDARP